jgi:Lon-like ATP-dependent protease
LKLVEELGEETFPEPKNSAASAAAEKKEEGASVSESVSKEDAASSSSSTPSPSESSSSTPPAVENLPEPNEDLPKETTTKERQPMAIPDTVHVRITPENLKEYVGPPVYQRDRMFGGTTRPESQPSETDKSPENENESDKSKKESSSSSSSYASEAPPGVSTGLGYLGNGSGAVMPIEAVAMPGKGSLQLTGKLGEVIRESAQIALSWVKAHAFELGVTNTPSETLLLDKDIHIHMPEGAVGKDGPSAGTAILVALVSLVTGKRVHGDTAMTGEMSLTGRVLAVGGLKEKILAAHRAEMKTLIVPGANRMDVEENVPDSVKEGIKFVYVESVNEVLEEVFKIKVGERERKWKEETKHEKEKEWKKEKQHKEKERRRE